MGLFSGYNINQLYVSIIEGLILLFLVFAFKQMGSWIMKNREVKRANDKVFEHLRFYISTGVVPSREDVQDIMKVIADENNINLIKMYDEERIGRNLIKEIFVSPFLSPKDKESIKKQIRENIIYNETTPKLSTVQTVQPKKNNKINLKQSINQFLMLLFGVLYMYSLAMKTQLDPKYELSNWETFYVILITGVTVKYIIEEMKFLRILFPRLYRSKKEDKG